MYIYYSLTRATLMSPGKDETKHVSKDTYIYIYIFGYCLLLLRLFYYNLAHLHAFIIQNFFKIKQYLSQYLQ